MQCKSYEWKSNIRRSTREELSLAESSSDRGEYEVHPGADLVKRSKQDTVCIRYMPEGRS